MGFKRPSLVSLIVVMMLVVAMMGDDVSARKPVADDATAKIVLGIFDQSLLGDKVAAWWDQGDMYKYLTQREVFWNDGLDNTNYWMSRVYLGDNGTEAAALLQSLACDKDKLNEQLQNGEELNVNCDAPDIFVIVDESYIGRLSSMATLAEQSFNQKAPYRNVSVSMITECLPRNEALFCGGYRITGMDAEWNNKKPVAYYNHLNGTQIKRFDGNTQPLSLVTYPAGGKAWAVILDDKYANTLLLRMLAGVEIEGFTRVYTVDAPRQVVVYKVALD